MREHPARWLLIAHDRMDSDDVPLTHEFLSIMLGARRPGLTTALNALQQQGVYHSAPEFNRDSGPRKTRRSR